MPKTKFSLRLNRSSLSSKTVSTMSNSDSGYQQTVVSIKSLLGPKGWRESGDAAAYYSDPRGRFTGRGNLVALPENTSEVSQVVSLCHQNKIPTRTC